VADLRAIVARLKGAWRRDGGLSALWGASGVGSTRPSVVLVCVLLREPAGGWRRSRPPRHVKWSSAEV